MKLKKSIITGIALTIAMAFVDAGTLKGHVKYDGKPPKAKRLKMDADPVCGTSHSSPIYNESFIMDENGNLANVIVYLKGITYKGGPPKEPAILDQKGCLYSPHVLGIMKGQELLIKNSDATLHNIHGLPVTNSEFNFAMPKVLKEKTMTK